METKQDRINESVTRLEKLINETIIRYTDEIDYDQDLSLYDVMMRHFVNGDLDDVFVTNVITNMSKSEKKALFELVREFQGLCFYRGNPEYWLDSLENTPVQDYSLIAYSILDSFAFLLELAKDGGRDVLEKLVAIGSYGEFQNEAVIGYLRTTFADNQALSAVLLNMAEKNSKYDIFTDEQKAILLSYPDGSLYSYLKDEIRITNPLVLGVQIYNNVESEQLIDTIDEENMEPLLGDLKEFFIGGYFDFYDEVLILTDKYRDYVRKNNISLSTSNPRIINDEYSEVIQDAWLVGDEVLGGAYDTPYVL